MIYHVTFPDGRVHQFETMIEGRGPWDEWVDLVGEVGKVEIVGEGRNGAGPTKFIAVKRGDFVEFYRKVTRL